MINKFVSHRQIDDLADEALQIPPIGAKAAVKSRGTKNWSLWYPTGQALGGWHMHANDGALSVLCRITT